MAEEKSSPLIAILLIPRVEITHGRLFLSERSIGAKDVMEGNLSLYELLELTRQHLPFVTIQKNGI